MEREDKILREYESLRKEIADILAWQNTLYLFNFTAVSAIFAIAFSNDNPYLFLLTFLVLIPVRSRYIYHYEGMIRAATYISVFLEPKLKGIAWETRLKKLEASFNKEFKSIIFQYFMSSIIGVFSYLFYFTNRSLTNNFWYDVILSTFPLLFVFYLIYIEIKNFNKSHIKKGEYIKRWIEVKNSENEI